MTAAVIVSIRVDATPLRAFEAFTEEIGKSAKQSAVHSERARLHGADRDFQAVCYLRMA